MFPTPFAIPQTQYIVSDYLLPIRGFSHIFEVEKGSPPLALLRRLGSGVVSMS